MEEASGLQPFIYTHQQAQQANSITTYQGVCVELLACPQYIVMLFDHSVGVGG